MSTSEDINLSSEREIRVIEQKCAYCVNKVVDFVLCEKCNESFHSTFITVAQIIMPLASVSIRGDYNVEQIMV